MSTDVHGDAWARGAQQDHAVNVVAGGPPPWLMDLLRDQLPTLAAYPHEAPAAEAVARRHGREPEEVVLLNGAAHGFGLVAQVIEARSPVVLHPQFTEPDRALAVAARPARHVVLSAPWRLDPAVVPPEADLVIVGNPTNPTGVLHPAAAIQELLRAGRTVVVDEAFMDFVPGEPETLAGVRHPGLIVIRSLTKILGVPGLRVGYLLAEPALAARLRDRRQAWPVNALALAACVAASDHPERLTEAARAAQADREALEVALAGVPGLRVHPGSANFVLVELAGADTVAQILRADHGIAVRPAATFPGLGEQHLRITARGGDADAWLVAALHAILG